jgi:Xaa-Pro aminopeptidase
VGRFTEGTQVTDFSKRRERLRRLLRKTHADAMLVTNFTNVRYLTGFTGDDSYLLVSSESDLLISDPRYEQQIDEECPGLPTLIRKPSELLLDVTCREIAKQSFACLTIEGNSLTVNTYDRLLADAKVQRLTTGDDLVESLRMIKGKDELQLIQRAVGVAERVFTSVRAQLTSRQTEREIANEIERLTRALGGSGCSFKPIVAVGPRAALPHATPGDFQIGSSPFVLIDWGATIDGYRSDLTRVLLTSRIPAKFAKIYETVLAAQTAAIDAMKPGVMVSEVDRAARLVVERAGMGPRFNHGLGHGIGLDIHEAPRLGKNFDRPLEAGMVVTVEPGVYYPGWGGIRIEDDVLITSEGCQVLSSLTRDMLENQVDLLA